MANLIGLIALAAWMLRQAYPLTRAVRLRNALLLRRGSPSRFDWAPHEAPPAFHHETRAPSRAFADAVADLDVRSCPGDWSRALRLADHLSTHAQDLGPIQSDLGTTYARIRDGYGYCADFVKAFLALAHAAGLRSRQWAFSLDAFGGHGHTVVEVFDYVRGKWLFLDVYNNFHACDAATMEPLGALELRDALLHGTREIAFRPNGTGRPGYPVKDKLLAYYRSGLQAWYLILGDAVFSYEAHPLVRWATRLSGSLGQIVATLLGVHPSIQVLATPENRAMVEQLTALGRRFRIALAVFGTLSLLLVVQLGVYALAAR